MDIPIIIIITFIIIIIIVRIMAKLFFLIFLLQAVPRLDGILILFKRMISRTFLSPRNVSGDRWSFMI